MPSLAWFVILRALMIAAGAVLLAPADDYRVIFGLSFLAQAVCLSIDRLGEVLR